MEKENKLKLECINPDCKSTLWVIWRIKKGKTKEIQVRCFECNKRISWFKEVIGGFVN